MQECPTCHRGHVQHENELIHRFAEEIGFVLRPELQDLARVFQRDAPVQQRIPMAGNTDAAGALDLSMGAPPSGYLWAMVRATCYINGDVTGNVFICVNNVDDGSIISPLAASGRAYSVGASPSLVFNESEPVKMRIRGAPINTNVNGIIFVNPMRLQSAQLARFMSAAS